MEMTDKEFVSQPETSEAIRDPRLEFVFKWHDRFINADPSTLPQLQKESAEELENLKKSVDTIPKAPMHEPRWGTMAGKTSVWGDGGTLGRNPASIIYQARYYLRDDIVFDLNRVYISKEYLGSGSTYASSVTLAFKTPEDRQKLKERLETLTPFSEWWCSSANRSWDWRYTSGFDIKLTFNGSKISWDDNVPTPGDTKLIGEPKGDPCNLNVYYRSI